MARLYSSGFELQSATNETEFTLVSGLTIDTTIFRSGAASGKVMNPSGGVGKYAQYDFSATDVNGPFYARTYIYVGVLPDVTTTIASFSSSAGPQPATVQLSTTGTLILRYNDGATVIGSPSSTLSTATWYMLELKIDRSPAAGSQIIDARLDGTSFASASNLTITNATDGFTVGIDLEGEGASVGTVYFDDIAVNDSTGSAQTSWPGSGKIVHLRPNAAGDTTAWTNDYTFVDEITPNDATDFANAGTTIGNKDEHNITDIATAGLNASDSITLVSVGLRFNRAAGAGTNGTFKPIMKTASGGSVISGTTLTANTVTWRNNNITGPRIYPLISYTDFTVASALDTAQIGYQLVTAPSAGREPQVSTNWMLVEYVPVSSASINVSDSTTVSESVSMFIPTFKPSVSDSVTVSESVGASIVSAGSRAITVSDSVTITESVAMKFGTGSIAVSDSVTVTESKNASIPQSFGINVSETVTLSESVIGSPYSIVFTWKGYTWIRRDYGGGPQYNGLFDPGNVMGPDTNDYLTLRISNPTGLAPIAAEFDSSITFGYGTYMMVLGSRVDNLPYSAVWGGMFTYGTTPIYFNEIDANETSSWGEPVAAVTSHNYYYNNGGVAGEHDDPYTTTSDPVTTHVLKWSPGRLEFNSYVGTGTGGTLLKGTVATANVPTPSDEVLIFNAWVFDGGSDNEAITPQTDIVIRDFQFARDASVSNTVTVTESVSVGIATVSARTVSVSDNVTVSESKSVTRNAATSRSLSVSDSVTVSESRSTRVPFTIELPTTLRDEFGTILTDELGNPLYDGGTGDFVTITESVSLVVNAAATPSPNKAENVTISESRIVQVLTKVNKSDSVTVTESVSIYLPVKQVVSVDNIFVGESANMLVSNLVVNVNDTVTTYDIPSVFAPPAGSIAIFLTENVITTEELVILQAGLVVNTSDSTTITESVAIDYPLALPISDTVTTTESIGFYISTFSIDVDEFVLTTDRLTVNPYTGSGPIDTLEVTIDASTNEITLSEATNDITINGRTSELTISSSSNGVILEA